MHAHKHAHRGPTSSHKKKTKQFELGPAVTVNRRSNGEPRSPEAVQEDLDAQRGTPRGSTGFLCSSASPVPAGSEQVGRRRYTHLIDFITPFLTGVGEPLAHYKTPERAHMHTCTLADSPHMNARN